MKWFLFLSSHFCGSHKWLVWQGIYLFSPTRPVTVQRLNSLRVASQSMKFLDSEPGAFPYYHTVLWMLSHSHRIFHQKCMLSSILFSVLFVYGCEVSHNFSGCMCMKPDLWNLDVALQRDRRVSFKKKTSQGLFRKHIWHGSWDKASDIRDLFSNPDLVVFILQVTVPGTTRK